MHTISSLATIASVALLALAGPVPNHRAFTLKQDVAKSGRSGPQALAHVYAKHGKTVPANIAAAAGSGIGSDQATPEQYDKEYLCPVTIGSQTLNLDFDTGSADLWVFSTEQPTSQTSGHTLYKPSSSKLLSGESWNISYGDGSGANGNVYADTVNIGGVTVTHQAVEAAQSVAASFTADTQNDGLVGLAFSSINTVTPDQQTTFFDTAVSQGALSSNLFAVDLKAGQPGSYDFGYIDNNKYTGSLTYISVDNSQGFWGFTATGYGVGDNDFTEETITGIADTGTSLILLPDDVVDAYWGQISGAQNDQQQGGYTFDCSATLPDFVVGVGNAQFTVPGSYMNFAPVDDSTCFGGLQSSGSVGTNIFGDVFLKAVYVVFDSNGPQLGFATKNL